MDTRKGLNEIKVAGIWLRRERHHIVVLAERKNADGTFTWVEVIREFLDSNFSHIIEPNGIANKFGGAEVSDGH